MIEAPGCLVSAPMTNAYASSKPTLLVLPVELRLLIYSHLIASSLLHADESWDGRSRRTYGDIWGTHLPETKLVYFNLHALSASCRTIHAELQEPIEQVRKVLAKQKHFCEYCP